MWVKLTWLCSSGVWGGQLSRVLGGQVGAPDLQPPQDSCGKVPLHPAAGEHVLNGDHGDVGVLCNRWGHLRLRVTANVPLRILPVFPMNNNWYSFSVRLQKVWLNEVIESIVCFQETMLETEEPSSPCISSWTRLLASTLNSSKCSSGRVFLF